MFVEEPFQKEQLLPINLAVDRNAFKAKAQLTNHLSSNEKTIWTCLSEGAASGAFGVFLYLSSSLYVSRNFYYFLFIKWLTYFMACGATIGLAAGGTIRLYARLRRNEPGLVVRLLNGILITGL